MNTENDVKEELENIKKIHEMLKKLNKKQYYYINTMGCTLNENDSEKVAGMLDKMGYIETNKIEEANIIVFNTCCIRENAEEKLFGKLGEAKKIKENTNAIIALCGCMMQQEHILEKIKKSYNFVDIIFGTHTLYKLPKDILQILKKRDSIVDIENIDGNIYEGIPVKRTSKTKALVSITFGCNNFCTYCIVPYVRGRERSRSPKDILSEVISLAKEGYKEITLLGQNVNSYKGDGYNDIYTFADLLRALTKIDRIEVINFLSPHPKDFSDDVIDAIASSPKIDKIIHLPLQSGSTNVLKRMNRKYSKEQYLELVNKIRSKIPDVAFSTDIIVGFPGETEEDFMDTLDVVDKVCFDQVFMFIYSIRHGTPAEKMDNQIPENIKHERFNRLQKLVENKMSEVNKKYIGKEENLLVLGKSKNNENMLSARTKTNKVVVFEGKEELIGKMVKVKVISEHLWYLRGEIVS